MEEKQLNPELNPQENEKHVMTDEELEASLYDNDVVRSMSDDELQDTILADSNLNGFQKWIARMDDAQWTRVQRITGAVLGLLAALALFWDTITGKVIPEGQEPGLSMSLIVAVAIAMLVPNIIEKQGKRKTPKLRVALAAALCVALVAFVICMITGVAK